MARLIIISIWSVNSNTAIRVLRSSIKYGKGAKWAHASISEERTNHHAGIRVGPCTKNKDKASSKFSQCQSVIEQEGSCSILS